MPYHRHSDDRAIEPQSQITGMKYFENSEKFEDVDSEGHAVPKKI